MAVSRVVAMSILAALVLGAASCDSRANPPAQQQGALPDDYQVIMWVLGGLPENQDLYFQRLREAGVTAIHILPGESPEPALARGFGFYVENIHRIGFLHGARKVYEADWQGYTTTRDKRYLIRKPCLHDPAYLASAREDIQSKIRPYVHLRPLLYDLGDECSITSFASPMDYCFSDHTLAAFRAWLRQQYGSLDRLNEEWETEFRTWDEVVPMTTYEVKERERRGSENYSPWADHRTFMDLTFAETWRLFRSWIRELDPVTPVGLEGTQMPSAFGGYDLWRLSQVVDWVEPYDVGCSHAIFRSFLPPGAPMFATVFEHDAKLASRRLWHLLLNGDRGCIIWASSEWFDYSSPDLKPRPWVADMARLFAELRGPAARAIMKASREPAPIAIHYSHPSIQVGWMLDSREDGDTWPRRFSSYESVHSRITRVRNSWTKLIEDLGLQYDFVSSQQILEGVLEKRGYRVLILPQSLAIGDAEAESIRKFVESGGAVIADCLAGLFDEHGKRRPKGVLDDLFGLSRLAGQRMVQQPDTTPQLVQSPEGYSWEPAEPVCSATTPLPKPSVMIRGRPTGKGSVWYLNLCIIDYAKLRLEGKGGEIRGLIGELLHQAGVSPAVKVTGADGGPPVGFEVIVYRGEGCRYLAIMRNPEYHASELGELGYADNSRFEKPEQVHVDLGQEVVVKDLRSGQDLGRRRELTVTVDPWKPTLLELR